MNKYIFIGITFFAFFLKSNGQRVSELRMMDLSIIPLLFDSDTNKYQKAYKLAVKIDSIDLVNKVYFSIGTEADPLSVLDISTKVINEKDNHLIWYKEKKYQFANYTLSLDVSIPRDKIKEKLILTFYAEDKKGLSTNELSININ